MKTTLANWVRRFCGAALLGLVSLPLPVWTGNASAIPEPDTIFYGQVFSFDHGYDVLLTQGALVWRIQPNGDDTRMLELQTPLEGITNGARTYSYRLKVPHQALASGLTLADVSPETLAVKGTAERYRHVDIRLNGESTRVLPPASPVFEVAQTNRLSAYRLDLEVVMPMPDTDGQGLPDWWQQRFFGHRGVDPNADADGDGLANLEEYLGGTDPTAANSSPTIVWQNSELDEGATEVMALQAVDTDSSPTNLTYTVLQEPQGAHLTLLFGATVPGANGKLGDRVLRVGDRFTQAQVNAGQLAITHDDPLATQIPFRLSLSDGTPNRPPYEAEFTLQVHKPTPDDGTGAAVWLSSRFMSMGDLTTWADQSGAKPWLTGTNAPFDAEADRASVLVTNLGPLGQPVLALNQTGSSPPQSLTLPPPSAATVFPSGEITVFAVFRATGGGGEPQQIVSGPHFQLGLTGPADAGRDQQVRFASEGIGVVYGNHEVANQWTLISAWQQQGTLSLELNGNQVGGPLPLDLLTRFGTDPTVGARNTSGQVDQRFQGLLGEVLVFPRNLEDAERHRISYSLMSKWFGWILLDGSDEPRDLDWRVPSSGLSAQAYQTDFVPQYGPDRNYILLGGAGHDKLRGGQNDDIIVGGRQADIMTGGGGHDVFVFNFAHINHGPDTITDFSPATERDAINVADLLRGSSRDLRDYLHLRTNGHDSYLDIDFAGARRYTDHTIALPSVVLRDDDLPGLWAHGNLLTGNKRVPLTASLMAAASVATEVTGAPAVFTVRFNGAMVPDALEMPFQLGGTAVRGTDYHLSVQRYNSGTGAYDWVPVAGHELFVEVKPGDTDFAVRVEPIQNNGSQPDRTVQLQLTAVPEWFDLTNGVATVQITDGPQRVGVVATDPSASESSDPGAFTLTRIGSLDVPLDVTVQMTGPAQNGIDYQYIPTAVHFTAGQSNAVVSLVPFPARGVHGSEAAEMIVQPAPGYVVDPAAQAATVVIQSSGPVITVEVAQPLAVVQAGTPAAFLLRRQGPLNASLVVRLDVRGTATMNLDYQNVNGFVTFAAGASTAMVSIQPLATASVTGGVETVDLQVMPDASYAVGTTAKAEAWLVNAYVTFAQWKTNNFPGDTTALSVFAAQDFDRDGVPHAAEYAFGLDPRMSNAAGQGLPTAVKQNGRLGVRFMRPVGVVDVAYSIEVSSDLVNWAPPSGEFQALPGVLTTNGLEQVIFLDPQALSASPRRFVRVRAKLQ